MIEKQRFFKLMQQVSKINKKKPNIIPFICWVPSIINPIFHPGWKHTKPHQNCSHI
jgi:hypothetical protein